MRFYICLTLLTLCSYSFSQNDKVLNSFNYKKFINKGELKTGGVFMSSNRPYKNKPYSCFYFYYFFNDGTIYKTGILGALKSDINEFILRDEYERKRLCLWGGYLIDNDTIKVQILDKTFFGNYNFNSTDYIKIINDSTLFLSKIINSKGDTELINDTLKFGKLIKNYDSNNPIDEIFKQYKRK
jgi:hypothetical protein